MTEGVSQVNSILKGYRGEEEAKKTTGEFDKILITNQSSTFPWFIDYNLSKVSTDSVNSKGITTCTVFRDWLTDWSEIQIKA